MGQLTLQLPETLQKELEYKARGEGIALPQYILYLLSRQVNSGYFVRVLPPEEVNEQRQQFDALLERWGATATEDEIDRFLAEREIAEPEPGLTPELVAKLKTRIDAARSQHPDKNLVVEPT